MPFRAVSTFWIAHPNNNLINNAAAGSQVNNTEVHQCFFAFLFVSVLVYMYMQHSMWSSNSSTLLSGTACFSLLSEQAVVEMVLLFLLHHLCQLVFMSVQRQMLNGRKEGASMSGLEKEMATHSSTLAWEIPWTEEPGRLQSMGSLRTQLSDFTFTFHSHALEKEMQPTPVFLPGESQGRGSLVGCHLWGRTESDTTEVT